MHLCGFQQTHIGIRGIIRFTSDNQVKYLYSFYTRIHINEWISLISQPIVMKFYKHHL